MHHHPRMPHSHHPNRRNTILCHLQFDPRIHAHPRSHGLMPLPQRISLRKCTVLRNMWGWNTHEAFLRLSLWRRQSACRRWLLPLLLNLIWLPLFRSRPLFALSLHLWRRTYHPHPQFHPKIIISQQSNHHFHFEPASSKHKTHGPTSLLLLRVPLGFIHCVSNKLFFR